MTKLFTLAIFFLVWNAFVTNVKAQANPSAAILPANAGLVSLGSILDIKVTITNTKTGNIVAYKLRPNISIPAILTILPNNQQTGLPAGWQIVSNTGNGQIRICNGTDVISGFQEREIIIKVQGATVGFSTNVQVQVNFGGATCAVTGPQPNGNVGADDFASASISVLPGCNLKISSTADNIICNEGTTTLNAVTINATGPVEYSITNGASFQISNVFNNVMAGSYIVTAREISNPTTCVAVSALLTINDPVAISAPTVSIVQPTCTVSNGILNITSETTDLTFSVDEGSNFTIYNGGISLPSGLHSVRAKNANNCVSPITNFFINIQPLTPATPMLGDITQPDCIVSTGAVKLNGLPVGSWIINPGNIAGNTLSAIVSMLTAGTYNFTVTNDFGCASLPTINVNINNVADAPAAPIINETQPTCSVATGSVRITSSAINLTYSIDGGSYQDYPGGGFTGLLVGNHSLIAKNISGCLSPFTHFIINEQPVAPPAPIINILQPSCSIATGTISITLPTSGNTYSFNNGSFAAYPTGGFTATAGTYNLAAQNSNGCNPSVTENIIVNPQPLSPIATLTASPVICSGGTTTLTVLATGALSPYEYSLNNGAYQISNTFNAVSGNYTATVKDAKGCTGVTTNISVVEPNKLVATLASTTIACNAGNSTLTVLATGGTGSFEYSLNNGVYQPSNIFNVIAGTYSVSVRSIANTTCSVNTSALIISQPSLFKATSAALPIYYCGGSTVVNVGATGGTKPYIGIGDFVKGPGIWSYSVTDANGCTSSTDVIIVPPGCVDLKVFPNPAKNLITVNHSAALSSAEINIYSLLGSKVLSQSVPVNTFISSIDISILSSDVYLLFFTNGKEQKVTKFIKTIK